MSTLERALAIAAEAHAGQLDKLGAPYILHPLRVMMKVATYDEQVVAVLHDVVEDSDWTLDRLRAEGFSDAVIAGVDAMTRRDGEEYEAYVHRAAIDPVGRRIKRADLEDNIALRLGAPRPEFEEQVLKYWRALTILGEEGVS